jgi:hypothetical protein
LFIILPICLQGQSKENKLFIELTDGYDLSIKSSYRRKIISLGENGALGVIHNLRLGANIGYILRSKFYIFTGAKINMNSIPPSNNEGNNLFLNIFFSTKTKLISM